MSIGSLGIVGGLAGTALPQRAADADRVQRETVEQQRAVESSAQAENAAGIGQTEEDSQTAERDADGRRPWEQAPRAEEKPADTPPAAPHIPISKDPTGACGGQLDLVG
jgi:type II secretory pathway pseudopilin PulG